MTISTYLYVYAVHTYVSSLKIHASIRRGVSAVLRLREASTRLPFCDVTSYDSNGKASRS